MNIYYQNEMSRLEDLFAECHLSIRKIVDEEFEFYKNFENNKEKLLQAIESDGLKINYVRINADKKINGNGEFISFASHLLFRLCEPFVDKNGFINEYGHLNDKNVRDVINFIGKRNEDVLSERMDKGLTSLRKGLFIALAKPIIDMNFELAKSATSTLIRHSYVNSERESAINLFTGYYIYGKQTHFDSKMEATKFIHKIEGIKRTYQRAIESEAKENV